jgi:HKD family nuclease
MSELITTEDGRLRKVLLELAPSCSSVDIVVGYANEAGFDILARALETSDRVRLLLGMEVDGSILDAVRRTIHEIISHSGRVNRLVAMLKSEKLEIRYVTNGKLHAKAYVFNRRGGGGKAVLGSSNLTPSGLVRNREWSLKDETSYEDILASFEEEWANSSTVATLVTDLDESKPSNGAQIVLSQYEIFIRVLHSIYGGSLNVLTSGSVPSNFKVLKYQEDAVVQLDTILRLHNGCFLADVVGLGKTYVSALSLLRLPADSKALVTCPAGMVNVWRSVLADFGIEGVEVCSHQKLKNHVSLIGKDYKADSLFTHIYVDEAHKFRNHKTTGYKMLKSLCSIERGTKVVLITATPLNNNPVELRTMLALFQNIRGRSTIIEGQALNRYLSGFIKDINKARASNDKVRINREIEKTSKLLRDSIINKITIRRTRKDITKYYAEDMVSNDWAFPVVQKPKRVDYVMSDGQNMLLDMTQGIFAGMSFARYKLQEYLFDMVFDQSHKFLSNIIKVNLMKRMDSGFYAFTESLRNMVEKHEQTVEDFNKGFVRKVIHDVSSGSIVEDGRIPLNFLKDPDHFLSCIQKDLETLRDLLAMWTGTNDSKLKALVETLNSIDLSNGKVILFSQYKDTVEYLEEELSHLGFRVLGYNSGVKNLRPVVDSNFDANHTNPTDDYDILVTTDSLSEGVNLHRSNKVINYDIPWNPTLVIQRVGRANRIGTKFDAIEIYNFFPTDGTDKVIKSEKNIISKLRAVFHLFGDDSNVLTDEDDLDSIETIESQIHDLVNAMNEEEADIGNVDSYYQSILRGFKSANSKHFSWLTSLTGDVYGNKNSTYASEGSLFYVGGDGSNTFNVVKDGDVSFLGMYDALSLLECSPTDSASSSFDLDSALKQRDLSLAFHTKSSGVITIFEDMGFDTGGKITQYLKKLYNYGKEATKQDIKQIIDNIRQEKYIVDGILEQQMKDVVTAGGTLEELQELFDECELKDDVPCVLDTTKLVINAIV